MTGNKYEQAVAETRSVLSEWFQIDMDSVGDTTQLEHQAAQQIVERLIAKGLIQSTDLNDLTDEYVDEDAFRGDR